MSEGEFPQNFVRRLTLNIFHVFFPSPYGDLYRCTVSIKYAELYLTVDYCLIFVRYPNNNNNYYYLRFVLFVFSVSSHFRSLVFCVFRLCSHILSLVFFHISP